MDNMEVNNDTKGSRFGMWLFLYSEIMLFGGLFILYAGYYNAYREGFVAGGAELDLVLGTVNTVILLTSSFAVASALWAIQKGSTRLSVIFLSAAVILGLCFLVIKFNEWSHKFHAGIYPGSEKLSGIEHGKTLFFALYFTITGLHALHVSIGITILIISLVFVMKKKITAERHIFLENAGLYWHLVDVLWIFIFPLLYLIV